MKNFKHEIERTSRLWGDMLDRQMDAIRNTKQRLMTVVLAKQNMEGTPLTKDNHMTFPISLNYT